MFFITLPFLFFLFFACLIILLLLLQIFLLYYSGSLFFKVMNHKIKEYEYENKDPVLLLFTKYGVLVMYVFSIYVLINHSFLGLLFMILLFFFNKELKKIVLEYEKNK